MMDPRASGFITLDSFDIEASQSLGELHSKRVKKMKLHSKRVKKMKNTLETSEEDKKYTLNE